MINKEIKKIFGDLGNLTKIDEHCWADEEGRLINLESTNFRDRNFNWQAEPGKYYINISIVYPRKGKYKFFLDLIKQDEELAIRPTFSKELNDPKWKYLTTDIIDIAGIGYNKNDNHYILMEISEEQFEKFRDQLKNTGKFEFKTEV